MVLTQCGDMPHDATCESIELLGREVMPEFREREEKRQREKAERVAPIIKGAMKPKLAPQLTRSTSPTIIKPARSYGRLRSLSRPRCPAKSRHLANILT